MNISRAIFSGAMMWLFIFCTFIILSFIPPIQASLLLQYLAVGLSILPFASLGAAWYFKQEKDSNGLPVALVMAGTAIILDALITVPLIEIPYNERGYVEFFTAPLFWVLVAEMIGTVYFYWKIKIKPIGKTPGMSAG